MTKLRDRIASIKKYLAPSPAPLKSFSFPHGDWTKKMLDEMVASNPIWNVTRERQAEPNDPITKALIVQQLTDITVKHPGVSVRRILSDAFADGVKDDYEFLEKLAALEKAGFSEKSEGEKIVIRTGRNPVREHQIDAATYAMRGLLDNMALANSPRLVMRDPSGGCSDPAGKSDSSSGK